MKLKYLLAASVVSLSAAATIATPAAAQQITSGIEGHVTDTDGNALSGAMATITDERTGQTRTTSVSSDGNFRVQSLQPGGPYTVTITADGFEGQTVEEVFTSISGNTSFDFALTATTAGGTDNVIVVTGARAGATQLAVGPGSAFDTATLEAFPSITRDIRDIIRIDPRVSLERNNNVDRISCLGGNDRSNTFTVDGIVQSDVFGLNGTPFAARNALPLPFDVIEQTSVEFAPFDVEYSDFTGCLVNVVTKAGTNEFHGSAFFTYFDEGLQSSSVEQADGDRDPFNAGRETRWGVTLDGPIIPDRLFFSFGYEETDLGDGFNDGPGSFGNEFSTVEQFNRFAQIANDVYGQDVGPIPTQLDESSVRYFGRLDAQVNADHRLVATYQRLEETNIEPDFDTDPGENEFGGLNSFENEGTISDYYSFQWYGDWSDRVSTELRVSRAEVQDVQGPVGLGEAQSGSPTVRLVVGIDNSAAGLDENARFVTGPGIFRSANELQTTVNQARFILNYDGDNGHFLKFGAEVNDLEVFNLFAINATGSIFFQNLDDFEQGLANRGFFSSPFGSTGALVGGALGGAEIAASATGNIADAGAEFSRQIYSFFVQDDWSATDQLSLSAGVRVQLYDGDAPEPNPLFLERFGFSNSNSFGRIDPVILPRLSATYELNNDGFFSSSRITGGVGIFAGGDPVVFFSNAFSNNGFSSANGNTGACDDSELNLDPTTDQIDFTPNGGAFTGFPACAFDAAVARAAGGRADVQSTDPDFDIPTAVRANIGFSSNIGLESGFFSDWRLNVDYIYTRFQDTLDIVDLTQIVNPALGNNGFAADGRPIIRPIDPLNAGCNATFTGNNPPAFSGVTPECFGTGIDEFLQLTNGPSLDSHNFSLILAKTFDEGIFTENGSVNVNFGYAFSDAEQTLNSRSSTATSTFDGTAVFDPQSPAISTSGFETRHNFTVSMNFREEFFDDYSTSLGIFFRASEGRPYSLVFNQDGALQNDLGFPEFRDGSSAEANVLAYIPTGVDDPFLSPLSNPVAVQQFLDAINSNTGILSDLSCDFTPGESVERNSCRNSWFFDMDLRLSQELPFIGSLTGVKEDRLELFVDVDNFLNMLDSGWNTRRALGGFEGRAALLEASFDDEGLFVLDNFNANEGRANTFESNTAWRIQIGARYEF